MLLLLFGNRVVTAGGAIIGEGDALASADVVGSGTLVGEGDATGTAVVVAGGDIVGQSVATATIEEDVVAGTGSGETVVLAAAVVVGAGALSGQADTIAYPYGGAIVGESDAAAADTALLAAGDASGESVTTAAAQNTGGRGWLRNLVHRVKASTPRAQPLAVPVPSRLQRPVEAAAGADGATVLAAPRLVLMASGHAGGSSAVLAATVAVARGIRRRTLTHASALTNRGFLLLAGGESGGMSDASGYATVGVEGAAGGSSVLDASATLASSGELFGRIALSAVGELLPPPPSANRPKRAAQQQADDDMAIIAALYADYLHQRRAA